MPMAAAPAAESFPIAAASSRCRTGQCPSLATVRSSIAMIDHLRRRGMAAAQLEAPIEGLAFDGADGRRIAHGEIGQGHQHAHQQRKRGVAPGKRRRAKPARHEGDP